ncbi:MAG: type II toxin-antitoxin system PemK/MazF family toxin [Nanoarchaeota archaeon]|nr:type II toxin-antitoxin system PemK/MazF family toxin [Nanoarchaeota archaeon]
MGTFTKGDIVLFPFPYTDLSSRKLRPSLVISNQMEDDILLCQITSKGIKKDKYTVELKNNELLEGDLMIDSYVRTNMIFTASIELILKKLCKVNKSKYDEIVESINLIIIA